MFYKKIDYIQILQQNQNRGDLSIYSDVTWQFRFFSTSSFSGPFNEGI